MIAEWDGASSDDDDQSNGMRGAISISPSTMTSHEKMEGKLE